MARTGVPPGLVEADLGLDVVDRARHPRRTPGSHTVAPTSRPSPLDFSYTSSTRPPTPGSMRLPSAASSRRS